MHLVPTRINTTHCYYIFSLELSLKSVDKQMAPSESQPNWTLRRLYTNPYEYYSHAAAGPFWVVVVVHPAAHLRDFVRRVHPLARSTGLTG